MQYIIQSTFKASQLKTKEHLHLYSIIHNSAIDCAFKFFRILYDLCTKFEDQSNLVIE